jgi:hypothetical protein
MPARSLPTPRGGSFAFATPGADAKPAETARAAGQTRSAEDAATVVAPPLDFDNDADLAIGREERSRETIADGDHDADTRVAAPIAAESEASGPTKVDESINPFEDAVWRREGGRDADAEIAGAHPIVGGKPLKEALVGFARNKRNVAIAAGGVVVLVVLIMLATAGSKQPAPKTASAKKPVKTQPAAKPTPDETAPSKTPSEGSAAAAPSEGAGDAPAAAESPGERSTESPSESPAESPNEHAESNAGNTEKPKPKAPTLGGKQVVLEYDTQAREAKPVPNAAKGDQDAIARARTSYAAGNTRLFAGDADGAIKNYKQALAAYPAYVAAYRGLGLAYAQKGDNAAAAKALRTYVSAAPGAKDAPIIRKRIQTLK